MGVEKHKRSISAPGYTQNSVPYGLIHNEVVTVTAAQLKSMNAVPVTIVAAPPTGYALVFDQVVFEMTTTATQFTGGGAVSFYYHGGSVSPFTSAILASVVTTTAGTTLTQLGPTVATNGITIPSATGLDITNASGAFDVGTGTAKVHLRYRIMTV